MLPGTRGPPGSRISERASGGRRSIGGESVLIVVPDVGDNGGCRNRTPGDCGGGGVDSFEGGGVGTTGLEASFPIPSSRSCSSPTLLCK